MWYTWERSQARVLSIFSSHFRFFQIWTFWPYLAPRRASGWRSGMLPRRLLSAQLAWVIAPAIMHIPLPFFWKKNEPLLTTLHPCNPGPCTQASGVHRGPCTQLTGWRVHQCKPAALVAIKFSDKKKPDSATLRLSCG